MDVYCSCHFGKQCLLTLFMDSVATDGGIGYIACSFAIWEELDHKNIGDMVMVYTHQIEHNVPILLY